jgi:hypothetical protein
MTPDLYIIYSESIKLKKEENKRGSSIWQLNAVNYFIPRVTFCLI